MDIKKIIIAAPEVGLHLGGYMLARVFWRTADLLDIVPGFTEGMHDAYMASALRSYPGPDDDPLIVDPRGSPCG